MVSKVKVNVPASLLFLFLVQQSLQSLQFLNQAELSVEVARVKAETVFSINAMSSRPQPMDRYVTRLYCCLDQHASQLITINANRILSKKILDYSIPE